MSFKVKGLLKDLGGASRVTRARIETMENGSERPDPKDPIRELADKLHPASMEFVVESVRDASPTSKTYRLRSADGHIPVFQAGGAMIIRPEISGIQFHSAAVDNYRHIVGKDAVTLVTNTDIIYLDNQYATDGTSFIAETMFLSGLTELDENGNWKLDMAESFDVSEDATVYTFKIRDDANWSDKDGNVIAPVTANDFVYAFDRLISDELASDYSWWISDVLLAESWEAVDDKTFKVTLSQPNGIFMQCLSFPSVFPVYQPLVESAGDQYATSADTVYSCGPYILDSWTPGYSYELKYNDNYYFIDDYKAAGGASKVVFRVLEDTQTALMEYEAGNIDTVILSGEQVDANKSVDGFVNRLQGYLFYLSININHYGE